MIFCRMSVTKQTSPIDFHSMEKKIKNLMEVNRVHQLFGYTDILQNIIVCLQQKNEIHTDLEQLESEQMMTEFSFF